MIGSRLKELRKERKMTQAELAKILKLNSWQTVSYYERGRNEPDDEIKVEIARVFNVSLDYLLGLIDEPVPFSRENYICLPDNCPPALKKELLNHYDLLLIKYKFQKK